MESAHTVRRDSNELVQLIYFSDRRLWRDHLYVYGSIICNHGAVIVHDDMEGVNLVNVFPVCIFPLDHNCIHASDVLHGVFFMTTKKIPGFCPLNQRLSNDSESDSDSGLNGEGRQKTNTGDYGALMDSIPLLELLALYTAATMHDYDHPGRTNAFLVATLSQQVSWFNLVALTLFYYGLLHREKLHRHSAGNGPIGA